MMLFNKTEGIFCRRAQDEQMNPAGDLHCNPNLLHSHLPNELALEKGVLPRSSCQVFVDGNEARVLSSEKTTLVLVHPDLKPVSVDGKAITANAESQDSMEVELTQGRHFISMQQKNSKSDNR